MNGFGARQTRTRDCSHRLRHTALIPVCCEEYTADITTAPAYQLLIGSTCSAYECKNTSARCVSDLIAGIHSCATNLCHNGASTKRMG